MTKILSSAKQFQGLVVLLATKENIYLSGASYLWNLEINNLQMQRLAPLPFPWLFHKAGKFRLLRRLARIDLRELVQLPSGSLVGVVQQRIVLLKPTASEFVTVFQVTNGGRPKGFAISPTGKIFVGEYCLGSNRTLHIWGSTDVGENWEVAHILRPGSGRHIHTLIWDQYRHGFWVLTGDSDSESALLFTGDEFKTLTECIRGSQLCRACHVFCRPEGLYYGTDSERAQNWFVFFDVTQGKINKIRPLPGSCIYAAKMAGQYFISTAVEPSKVNNYRYTTLWSSLDLYEWNKLVEFEKDLWPGLLGFGNIVLPRVQGGCPVLVFSTIAVKDSDFITYLIN